MRTTVDLPDDLLEQAKIAAIKRHTTVKGLIVRGLRHVLAEEKKPTQATDALKRLHKGDHLDGKPLGREELHVR